MMSDARNRRVLSILVPVAMAGCLGEIDGEGSVAPPSAPPSAPGPRAPAEAKAPTGLVPPDVVKATPECAQAQLVPDAPRRLSKLELNTIAGDVFGVTTAPFDLLAEEGYSKVGASLTAAGSFSEAYEKAVE